MLAFPGMQEQGRWGVLRRPGLRLGELAWGLCPEDVGLGIIRISKFVM